MCVQMNAGERDCGDAGAGLLGSVRALARAAGQGEALAALVEEGLDAGEKRQLLEVLVRLLWRVYRDAEGQAARFAAGQAVGLHLLPVHFYSPIPDTAKLPASVWELKETPGIAWREGEQLALLGRLGRWNGELAEMIAAEAGAGPGGGAAGEAPGSGGADGDGPGGARAFDERAFRFDNPAFAFTDAAVLYAMLRELRPRRMVEVGCGWSSLIASRAIARQEMQLVQIEPYPPAILEGNPHLAPHELMRRPVQEAPLSLFESLEENDILFIDSTHVSRIGSDVNHLMFEVLPRLRHGVVVHIHDIFLPGEYPRAWIERKRWFWNEQYVVRAFVMFNGAFEIMLANAYLRDRHGEALARAFSCLPRQNGGSLWLRRSR